MALQFSSIKKLIFRERPSLSLKACIIIPAKDEAGYIRNALDALRTQVDNLGNLIPNDWFEVLVLANNCSDATYEICKSYQKKFPLFQLSVKKVTLAQNSAHIGTVRRLLMDAAYDRLMSVIGGKGIIISTDADSEVSSHWLFEIINEISHGADVVGGRIISKDTPSLSRTHHLRDVTYRFLKAQLESKLYPCEFNPWPRHHQCFGASLAVTCIIYDRAGRLPAVPYLEDEAFTKAANRIDAKIRHSTKVIVHTSSRLIGKVDVGFSGQLKEWEKMSLTNQQQLEESFESVRRQFLIKNQLRQAWIATKKGEPLRNLMLSISSEIGMGYKKLSSMLNEYEYFECLWERIHQYWVFAHPESIVMQPVVEAIVDFRQYFASTRQSSSF